jgi:hypothetical protein
VDKIERRRPSLPDSEGVLSTLTRQRIVRMVGHER